MSNKSTYTKILVIGTKDDPECFINPLANYELECANGEFGAPWDGCVAKGSVRVRCPARYLPCNKPALKGDSFSCYMDCSNREGVKECLADGKLFATSDQYSAKILIFHSILLSGIIYEES